MIVLTFYFWLAIFAALRIVAIEGSYLDRPRLHFSGKFQADVSTRNNIGANFKIGKDDIEDVWNFLGTGDFRLFDTTVTSVTYLDGTSVNSKSDDPMIGLPISNSDIHTPGRLVDLDTEMQFKSEIWGETISLNWAPPGNTQSNSFKGKLEPLVLVHDMWPRICCVGGMPSFSASGKSIVTDIQWASDIESNFLNELKDISRQLSISLIVFSMNPVPESTTDFTFGEVRGTIGPAFPNEPTDFPYQRMLTTDLTIKEACDTCSDPVIWFFYTPFNVGPKHDYVAVDFGNTVAMNNDSNLLNLGTLSICIRTDGNVNVECLGDLNYQQTNWLEESAGIQEFPLTLEQYNLLKDNSVVLLREPEDALSYEFTDHAGPLNVQASTKEGKMSAGEPIAKRLVVLQERPIYARPWRQFVYRTNSYSTHYFPVYVTKYGQPMSDAIVHLTQSLTGYSNPVITDTDQGYPSKRLPLDGVKFSNDRPTTGDGIATFELNINKVGEPRKFFIQNGEEVEYDIPGQVYLYYYSVSNENEPSFTTGMMAPAYLTVQVHSDVTYPSSDHITWVNHVSPIFEQYAQLYPVMKPIVNMANYTDVKLKKGKLIYVLSLPPSHPSHMPVTRDLSDAKREMILKWLNNGCRYSSTQMDGPLPASRICKPFFDEIMMFYEKVPVPLPESCREGHQGNVHPRSEYKLYDRFAIMDAKLDRANDDSEEYDCMNVNWKRMRRELRNRNPTLDDVRCLLQTAIRLEFATLPPYLTALYSIIDGCNVEVQRVLYSICMQEMLHMAQAANLLIALGGHPIMNSPSFIPTYPGPLPGGVLPQLTVDLDKASIDHIRYNFMAIEFPFKTEVALDDPEYHRNTIGQFYGFIKKTLNRLYKDEGEDIFFPNRFGDEVSWPEYSSSYPGTLYRVIDINSARQAITQIMDQGEGTGPINPSSGLGDQLAHYYRFEEIVCGNKLVVGLNSSETHPEYVFEGATVEFDERGIYPMRKNPKTADFAPDTNAGHFSRVFNENFRHLLNRMHEAFNGQPWVMKDAVTIMESLKVHAIKLMRTPIDGSTTETAGPTWEFNDKNDE